MAPWAMAPCAAVLGAAALGAAALGAAVLLPPGLGEAPDADPASIGLRLRALDETGDRSSLLRLFARQQGRLGDHRGLATVIVMAACGRVTDVDALLAGPMMMLRPPVRAYWHAAAPRAAGDPAGGTALQRLAGNPDHLVALAARQRLAAPGPGPLGPEEHALLDRLRALPVPGPARAPLRQAPVTLALVALNLLAYGAELLLGGGEDEDVLFRLGSLLPAAVLGNGEWWRLGAALFLHYGPLHLGMNMLGLAAVGSRTEAAAGPLATLAVYAAAGLASTGGVLLLGALGLVAPEALVGASGAIMGLLGALLVDSARGWSQPGGAARRAALLLAAVVLLQVAFDLATPEVSLSAHLFGLAAGVLAAVAWRAPAPAPGPARRRARQRALAVLAAGAAALAATVWRAGGWRAGA